ncbi:hypothetical protein GEMRC1_004745 [Eukaryota sp. GEM-RC1]
MHVLIVDDDAVTRRSVAAMCRQCKSSTSVAENGKVALAILAQEHSRTDLIISDYMMPEMDGYELLKNIKSTENFKRIPVVIMSAFDDPSMVIRCVEAGAEDYLLKPVIFATVRRRIDLVSKTISTVSIDKFKELESKALVWKRMYEESIQEVELLKRRIGEMTSGLRSLMSDLVFMPSFSQSTKRAQEQVSEILQHMGEHGPSSSEFDVFHLLFELEGLELETIPGPQTATRRKSISLRPSLSAQELMTWQFDPFSMDNGQLVNIYIEMLDGLGLINHFNVDRGKLRNFVVDVSRHYRPVPYHNFTHAVDVSQVTFYLINRIHDFGIIEPIEQFALMVSALWFVNEYTSLSQS